MSDADPSCPSNATRGSEMNIQFFHRSYYRTYALRIVVNLVFLVIVHMVMIASVEILPKFNVNINEFFAQPEKRFDTSSYLFGETSILITLSGLIVVALMALLMGLGTFKIIPEEPVPRFRIRLLIYTLTNLAICCIISLYLFFIAAVMSSIHSYRINEENAFIWIFPFYAIVICIYLIEIYAFMTTNHQT